MSNGIKVLSLFDGISCGRVALERAGIPVEEYHAFEIDKYAVQVSQKNYPDIVHHGDVFDGDFTQFRSYDLLIGGSPCTYWSIAKNNRETTPDGIGGQLFMQYVRALKESGCKYFLYENNYSIHKNIKDFISNQLGVQPIMINSALVSAQQRKRCYWTNIPNITQPEDRNIMLKDILGSGVSWQDKSYCEVSEVWLQSLLFCKKGHGFNKGGVKKDKSPTLTAQGSWQNNNSIAEPVGVAQRGRYIESGNRSQKCDGGTEQFIEARKDSKSNCLTTVQKDSMVAVPIDTSKPVRIGSFGKGGQAQCIYSVHGKSVNIVGNGGGGGAKTGLYKIDLPDGDYIIRKMTPIEAERLQTLPDNYTEGISNTQRYKCIGNGWTVDVIAHILKNIKRA